MDLPAWLQGLDEYPKIYWKERGSEKAFAAAGTGVSPLSYAWRHFVPTSAPQWADFPPSFSFSPKFTQESSSPSSLLFQKPFVLSSSLLPDQTLWRQLVEKTLQAIEQNKLEKLVLARERLLQLSSPLDPWPLVSALEKKIHNAYLICIQPTPRSAFISFTPEKLFSRTGRTLSTEALAGTQKQKRSTLLSDPKQRREFHLVETSIQKALLSLTSSPPTFSSPSLRSTSGLEHLYSHLTAPLLPHVTDEHVLDQLHPTAALLGYPKKEAFDLLSMESFERGLYGAPLGRITPTDSNWAVGIRSCLLFESSLRLYSGAGLVKGSKPSSEWKELDQKLHVWDALLF